MGVKANWHLTDGPPPAAERTVQYDPLSDPSYAPPIPPIQISTSSAELDRFLGSLLDQEASLFERGITCPIKGKGDTVCLACPVSAERDFADPKGQLCRVGQEQERVVTVLVAQREGLG